ncbi:MAG: YHS domain-containing protein [Thermoanaerobaculia bacterium]
MTKTAQLAVLLSTVLLTAGCNQTPRQQGTALQVQTLESAGVRPAPVDPPPVLEEQTLPQRVLPGKVSKATKGMTGEEQPSPEEAMRAKVNLPFTPSIAMDPVDGSKVSITKDTPIYSYENKWYYFSSEANLRAFRANPEEFATGRLARY